MEERPEDFEKTIKIIAKRLRGKKYAIRGTASLVLQGLDMNVEDIDILCDKDVALACNKILKDYLVKKVKYSESGKHKSYFGEFNINSIKVEVMGEWKVNNKLFDVKDRKQIKIDNQDVWLTTIDSELKMFAAMNRWSAYWKIKRQIG